MDVKCPNCGKNQRKQEIVKVNEKELNEYKNQLKEEVKENIQNTLRDDFMKELKQIDEKYSAPNTVSILRFELKELEENLKHLREQGMFKSEHAYELSHRIWDLKSTHNWLMNNKEKTYRKLIEEFFKSTINEQKQTLEKHVLHRRKALQALKDKKENLSERISLKKQEFSIHKAWLNNKKCEIEDLEISISYLKEEIYKSKIEEKEWKKKNEILNKALKDN